ncbi:BTAD domain-containing putative transcriptional regulator [Streptomyces rapamycinicus]|uniref:BTAD domain-containing putative transcriptional regulator n=1 Tax=Streptomyces rapamycinicus TaxID=1226757 RepID=UPI000EF7B5CF|nr:hypothetical protein LIV37_50875 [Streptomyces rapamycinicus NRRL 5491]
MVGPVAGARRGRAAVGRDGTQEEALDHCLKVSRRPAEELGLAPGPPLRRLRQEIRT